MNLKCYVNNTLSLKSIFNPTTAGHYFGKGLIHDKGISEGDILLIIMQNGKTGMLRVYNITWFRDPKDMFSATVMFEGLKEK